jgi:hypothetical protein
MTPSNNGGGVMIMGSEGDGQLARENVGVLVMGSEGDG